MKKRLDCNTLEAYVRERGRVYTSDIMEAFGVSMPTVHRMFNRISGTGSIKRIHGGAECIADKEESLFNRKLHYKQAQKKAICAYAASKFVGEDDVVAIDGGTTGFHLVDFMTDKHVNVVTNGLRIACHAAQLLPYSNVLCSGGVVRPQLSVCVGAEAVEYFASRRTDVLMLTCSGADPTRNTIYELDSLIAEVKQSMIQNAMRVVLLITSDKMAHPSFAYLTSFERIRDVVCDDEVDPQVLEQYRALGCQVHVASRA